jgi:broad specificity phosphatase PhoE
MTSFSELNNDYSVMRHGLSVPNEKRIIVSHLKNGILPEYGLVSKGIEQVQEASRVSGFPESTVVVTSPFSRAYHTARILYRTVNADEFIIDDRLRERYFGDIELEDAGLYSDVWARDYVYTDHNYRGVESPEEVAERGRDMISDLEKKFAGRAIVLVGHADPLNILKARLAGVDIRSHRLDFSIGNGEIQPLAPTRVA